MVIELLARFDEESNISRSKQMQDAGIQVIFGVEGLKVHSKITHIDMKKGPNIACVSTGNFHEGNARLYTDVILMTANRKVVNEVLIVFDFIEHPYKPVQFKELLVSPNSMKRNFIHLIDNEIKNKKAGKTVYIQVKVNHITDPVIVRKLYEVSAAGVPTDLLVRGNCSLVPGITYVYVPTVGLVDGIIDEILLKRLSKKKVGVVQKEELKEEQKSCGETASESCKETEAASLCSDALSEELEESSNLVVTETGNISPPPWRLMKFSFLNY